MDYSKYESLLVEISEGICTLTLNRPEQRNTMSGSIHGDLENVFVDLARDPSIRVIIIPGAGKAFSAGGDIKGFAARAGTVEGLRHALRTPANTRRLFNNMLEIEQPIIAAINGDAIGFGASLALMCDITVMYESARIGDTHVKVGIVAGDGGAVIWPLLLGLNNAKDFLLRGRLANGVEAHELRLVNHVAPADGVIARAREIAVELAALPPLAVRWTKLSLNKMLKDQLNLVLDASAAFEMLTMQTSDFGEAANAFIDKRTPTFKGE